MKFLAGLTEHDACWLVSAQRHNSSALSKGRESRIVLGFGPSCPPTRSQIRNREAMGVSKASETTMEDKLLERLRAFGHSVLGGRPSGLGPGAPRSTFPQTTNSGSDLEPCSWCEAGTKLTIELSGREEGGRTYKEEEFGGGWLQLKFRVVVAIRPVFPNSKCQDSR